ncbi:NUDIX domain-containing protein [Pseudomonas sp. NPDC088368]|uniref:NUDIX domain-containing protein n=1 Tax=Pseudomonas sp. NPDC088368 TaxID=3364453 RepID=UPI00380CB6EE
MIEGAGAALPPCLKYFACKELLMKERATLICRRGEELLFVRRRQCRWNLPGGKIKRSETPRDAAYRELAEETGVCPTDLFILARYVSGNSMHFIFAVDVGPDQIAVP